MLCQLAATDPRSGPSVAASGPASTPTWPEGPLSTWPPELRRLWPDGDDPNTWRPAEKRRWIETGP